VTAAIVLAICCLAVTAGGWWWYLTRCQPHRKRQPGSAPPPSTLPDPAQETRSRRGHSKFYIEHRWSGRRPRLELTETGLRDTSQQIRICLECAAEKTEDQPSSEMESK
jgi:hypothetical protein